MFSGLGDGDYPLGEGYSIRIVTGLDRQYCDTGRLTHRFLRNRS